jgi:GNAT superfamily N-acetyltransferase
MPEPSYRAAGPDDVDALLELRIAFLTEAAGARSEDAELRRAIRDYFAAAFAAGTFVAYVAQMHGKVIAASGMVIHPHPPSPANRSGKSAYIMNMYTVPEHRRRGIATALLELLLDHARREGCGVAVLHAMPNARALYAKAGFVPADTEMRLNLVSIAG